MTDIVERLRHAAGFLNVPFLKDAADEIERLREDVARQNRTIEALASIFNERAKV